MAKYEEGTRETITENGLTGWIYKRSVQREDKKGNTVTVYTWYLDIEDPSGHRRFSATRSLKTSGKGLAREAAKRLLRSRAGVMVDGEIDYLLHFWDPSKSRKLQARKASGTAPSEQFLVRRRAIVKKHVLPWLRSRGIHKLGDLTYAACQDLLNEKAKELKPGTVGHLRSAILAPLDQAVRENILSSNVMRLTERPQNPRQTREHIPWPMLVKILQPGHWSTAKAYTGALLSVSTGMRSGELRALLWRYVDTDEGLVDVVHSWDEYGGKLKPPKNGKPRYGLRLPEMVARELDKLRPAGADPDSFVFTRPDGVSPVAHNFFLYNLRAAAKRAGVELSDTQTFHSLRHTKNSYDLATADRVRSETVLQIMGHADTGTQQIYRHTTEYEQDLIKQEWDDRFSQIG